MGILLLPHTTHVPRQRLSWPVRALRRMGALQSAAHHAPRRADLAGTLLLAVLVLGFGSGCASPGTGDPVPGVLRAISGAEAAGWYVRAAATALPVTRGVTCPTSSWNLEGAAGEDAPRPAIEPGDSSERAVAVRSPSERRR